MKNEWDCTMIDGPVNYTSTHPLTHQVKGKNFLRPLWVFGFGVTVRPPSNSTKRTSCLSGQVRSGRLLPGCRQTQTHSNRTDNSSTACCSMLHLWGVRATPSRTVATSVLRASRRHGNKSSANTSTKQRR